jgi:hypothetical protein
MLCIRRIAGPPATLAGDDDFVERELRPSAAGRESSWRAFSIRIRNRSTA